MRFAAVVRSPKPRPQPARTPASELIRRLVAGDAVGGSPPHAPALWELPSDLDQRVRLVGEW